METKPSIEAWKTYSLEEYREAAATLVHFSAKGVNSNAEAGGVRLDPGDGLDLPYVSARCLLACGVGLEADYTKNAGNTATVVKQIRKLAEGVHGEAEARAQSILEATAKALESGHTTGTETVSPRLRQILLPKGNGEYLAITPLPAGGLSQVINSRVKAHNEAADEARKQATESKSIPRRLRRATLGVGGANPQNVGALVREMQSPLVFEAPTENPALREAYRIHYQGIPIRLPYRPMRAWRDWRDVEEAKNGGSLPTNLETREAEKGLVLAVAQTILGTGPQARRLLEAHLAELPSGKLLSDELEDEVLRGLIEPAERQNGWARAFAGRLAKEMGRYAPGGDGVLVSLNSEAQAGIAAWIEELAR